MNHAIWTFARHPFLPFLPEPWGNRLDKLRLQTHVLDWLDYNRPNQTRRAMSATRTRSSLARRGPWMFVTRASCDWVGVFPYYIYALRLLCVLACWIICWLRIAMHWIALLAASLSLVCWLTSVDSTCWYWSLLMCFRLCVRLFHSSSVARPVLLEISPHPDRPSDSRIAVFNRVHSVHFAPSNTNTPFYPRSSVSLLASRARAGHIFVTNVSWPLRTISPCSPPWPSRIRRQVSVRFVRQFPKNLYFVINVHTSQNISQKMSRASSWQAGKYPFPSLSVPLRIWIKYSNV